MQTVLVVGGAGFIGSHLCERLLKDGYRVICIDNLSTGDEKNIEHLKDTVEFTFIRHDVTQLLEADIAPEFVFHLASPASPNHHSSISYHALPMETMMVNTVGTKNLLELAEKHNARFVFASTSEVYGDPLEHPQKEEYRGNVSSTGPRSVYDESKRFGETLVSYYNREHDLDARIARIFNTYGPHMAKKDMRMIITFITEALDNRPITLFGDGQQTRSLCFVSDTVDGLMKLMFSDRAKGEIVNIGSPDEKPISEYAEIVKRLTGSGSEIVKSEALPEDDPLRRRPDITKAKELLGWAPTVPLEEGLRRTIEYIQKT
jgi:nucleoside-diphosphate-sugar epimerase